MSFFVLLPVEKLQAWILRRILPDREALRREGK